MSHSRRLKPCTPGRCQFCRGRNPRSEAYSGRSSTWKRSNTRASRAVECSQKGGPPRPNCKGLSRPCQSPALRAPVQKASEAAEHQEHGVRGLVSSRAIFRAVRGSVLGAHKPRILRAIVSWLLTADGPGPLTTTEGGSLAIEAQAVHRFNADDRRGEPDAPPLVPDDVGHEACTLVQLPDDGALHGGSEAVVAHGLHGEYP